jgi:hypothetical protein
MPQHPNTMGSWLESLELAGEPDRIWTGDQARTREKKDICPAATVRRRTASSGNGGGRGGQERGPEAVEVRVTHT